jgi:hypothetical protein
MRRGSKRWPTVRSELAGEFEQLARQREDLERERQGLVERAAVGQALAAERKERIDELQSHAQQLQGALDAAQAQQRALQAEREGLRQTLASQAAENALHLEQLAAAQEKMASRFHDEVAAARGEAGDSFRQALLFKDDLRESLKRVDAWGRHASEQALQVGRLADGLQTTEKALQGAIETAIRTGTQAGLNAADEVRIALERVVGSVEDVKRVVLEGSTALTPISIAASDAAQTYVDAVEGAGAPVMRHVVYGQRWMNDAPHRCLVDVAIVLEGTRGDRARETARLAELGGRVALQGDFTIRPLAVWEEDLADLANLRELADPALLSALAAADAGGTKHSPGTGSEQAE